MNRATNLYAFCLLASLASAPSFLVGCAAPIPYASNVVRDSDIRDCSQERLETVDAMDVAIVIDTSQSTRRPAGIDVDGDGAASDFRANPALDRGDSRLAAEIAAIRSLLRNASGHDIRFSIITFSGASGSTSSGKSAMSGSIRASKLRAALTRDTQSLEVVLTEVMERGSNGSTVFYAGMTRASRALARFPAGDRRRVVLFMSDAPRPTAIDVDGEIEEYDPRMKSAALAARARKIVFHTFGLSDESGAWRRETLGRIAGATGGNYHAVEDPRQFYCHLASSLDPSRRQAGWQRAFVRREREKAGESEQSLPMVSTSPTNVPPRR